MENMALLLSAGKPVATTKAWFTRATQMLFTLPTQTQGQHIRMRSPSPFYLAVMACNQWNMSYIFTLRLHLRRTCKPGLIPEKHTMQLHVAWKQWVVTNLLASWKTEVFLPPYWLKKTASVLFQITPSRFRCSLLLSFIRCFLTMLWYSRISWNISFLPNLAANVSGVRPWLFLTNGSPRILCFLRVAWKNMSYKIKKMERDFIDNSWHISGKSKQFYLLMQLCDK